MLPEGNIITVAAKRFLCADVFLQQYFMCKGASKFYDTSLQTS